MGKMVRLFLLGVVFVTVGCGGSSKPTAVSSVGDLSDTSAKGILAYIQKGDYKQWKAEAGIHDSKGPHGMVRSFFNPTVVDSINAKQSAHPKGSMVVKELYKGDGKTLDGYAFMVKTAEGSGGDTWLWFEGLSPDYNQYYGQGLTTCTGCHGSGTDSVISSP